MKSVLPVAIASLGLILAFLVLGNAYKYRFTSTQNISVTGLSERDFSSDQIVWSGGYTRKNLDLKMAFSSLKSDEAMVKAYLIEKGVADSEMVFSAISIEKQFTDLYNVEGRVTGSEFTGYKLSQTVTVDSRNIDKVEKLSREVTGLIEQGIEFSSNAPSYYYSRLSELKVDLLAKASADAKLRAETIAGNAGSSLGDVRSASMGVFQITGKNSNEDFSYGGVFNTSSRYKTASITIRMEFAAD